MALTPMTVALDCKIPEGDDRVAIMECEGSNAGVVSYGYLHGMQVLEKRAARLSAMRERYGDRIHCVFFGEMNAYKEEAKKVYPGTLGDPANIVNPEGYRILCENKEAQKYVIPAAHAAPWIFCRMGDADAVLDFIAALRTKTFPDWIRCNPDLVDLSKHPYVVVKKNRRSMRGEGVRIRRAEDIDKILFAIDEVKGEEDHALIEGFVPSKAIRNPRTDELHDGSIRYALDCVIDTGAKTIEDVHELSFWRLSAASLQSSTALDDALRVTSRGDVAPTTEQEHALTSTAAHAMLNQYLQEYPEDLEHHPIEGEIPY